MAIKEQLLMMKKWALILGGQSYFHTDQSLGRYFSPGELKGYFNDMTAKTSWQGKTDKNGVPLLRKPSGEPVHMPATIFQKGLGHWDKWLASGKSDKREIEAFMNIADWAGSEMDGKGGWRVWDKLGLTAVVPYSGMVQGQGVSLLVRAYHSSGSVRYLENARAALDLMLKPAEKGGTSRIAEGKMIFEERPMAHHNTILNGWIFSIFGLYDYLISEKDDDLSDIMGKTVLSLETNLPEYDAGYWSFYDQAGNISSWFYHRLHIEQIKALELAFPESSQKLFRFRRKQENNLTSKINVLRATAAKISQKIQQPDEVILE